VRTDLVKGAGRGALALAVLLLGAPSGVLATHLEPGLESSRARADGAGVPVPFAAFEATVTVQGDGFVQYGWFTLGAGSPGVNPLTQDVRLSVGTFAISIPAGAFRRTPGVVEGRPAFVFEGTIAGTWLDVRLVSIGAGSFELKVEGRGEPAMEIVRPEFVTLAIGEDAGSLVTATVEQGV
jgi:hypothetical protein